MRAKRRILLVCADEFRLSLMSFVLTTRGYRLDVVSGVDEAMRHLRPVAEIDAVLIVDGDDDGLRDLRREMPDMPLVWLAPKDGVPSEVTSRVIPPAAMSYGLLLKELDLACVKKRGPKPSFAGIRWGVV